MDVASSFLVLVVDDDAGVRDSLCTVLESAGYRTLTAENGSDAIAQLGAGPDLVLTDVNMAGSTGLEVINAIRWAGYDPLQVALKLGAVRVIHKDKMDELLPMIEQVLGSARA